MTITSVVYDLQTHPVPATQSVCHEACKAEKETTDSPAVYRRQNDVAVKIDSNIPAKGNNLCDFE